MKLATSAACLAATLAAVATLPRLATTVKLTPCVPAAARRREPAARLMAPVAMSVTLITRTVLAGTPMAAATLVETLDKTAMLLASPLASRREPSTGTTEKEKMSRISPTGVTLGVGEVVAV